MYFLQTYEQTNPTYKRFATIVQLKKLGISIKGFTLSQHLVMFTFILMETCLSSHWSCLLNTLKERVPNACYIICL